MGWVGVAMSAVSAISSINQGQAAEQESRLNAALMEGKAGLIDVQKDIEKGQYQRLAGKAMGTGMANMAASGVGPSGSPMAVMLETQKQIALDQAIGQFNLEQQKRYTLEEAEAIKRKGKLARNAAYTNAFSSVLQGASSYATYKGWDTSAGAKKAGTV